MLSLLLMLVSDPLATGAPVPPSNPEIRLRVMDGLNVVRCDGGGYQRIEQPSEGPRELRPDLTWRPNGEVRRYLLLDRTVRGCPAPISYAVPDGQDGFIRELGRTAPPVRFSPPDPANSPPTAPSGSD
ncbi:hypothetical protein [Brevundimonas sp.]|uniref:hypothetical protein n=1 Tax=Brevundimonas sp. TaxID=1871086 RepID=UPI002BAC15A9|nr:hypothetical protein [Brevundimonas sp.]HWQ86003.1 hypothetical protein [Brevundimonas sp.]